MELQLRPPRRRLLELKQGCVGRNVRGCMEAMSTPAWMEGSGGGVRGSSDKFQLQRPFMVSSRSQGQYLPSVL